MPQAAVVSVGPLEQLAEEWDELADRCAPAPFVRPGWIEAWMQAFGSGTLEVLCARSAGRLVGVLPLTCRGRRLEAPTNFHTPEFALLADGDDARRALADAAFARRPRHLSVGFLDAQRPDADALRYAARARGYHVIVRTLMRSPYLVLEGDWASYERGLGRQLLGDLRRSRRRLEERGEISIAHNEGSEHVAELLEDAFAVESRSWKAEANTAITSDRKIKRFYEQIGQWADGRGSLTVTLLKVEDQPVAMEMGLEEAGVHFALKGSYDESYRRFSPGKLLLHEVIQHAFARGLKRVELLGAEDQYKRRWAPQSRDRMVLSAYADSPIGWLEWTTDAYGRPLARRAGLARLRRRLQRIQV